MSNKRSSYIRVLSNLQFSLLWSAQLISQSGDYIFNVALIWLVLKTTGSVVSVGQTLAVILLPNLVVGPIAGICLDRFNRKYSMLVSNLVQAGIVFTIGIMCNLGKFDFAALLVMIFLLNTGAQFFKPAVTATIPQIVHKQDLVSSNALMSFTTNLNQLAGYGIGGVVVALFGIYVPLYYDCLTFLVALALIAFLNKSCCTVNPQAGLSAQEDLRKTLAEGLTFIRTNRILSELVVVGISIHFAEAAAYALFAPYSEITLQANSATYGFMLAMISAGTAGGSVLVGKLDVGRHMGKMLLLGIFGTGIGFTILGQVSTPGIALAISFAVGVFAALVALPIQVLLQSIVPGRLLGRVTTSLVALFSASQPLGSIVAGTISNSLTPATGLSLLGIFTAVSIFLMSFWFKDLRYSGF